MKLWLLLLFFRHPNPLSFAFCTFFFYVLRPLDFNKHLLSSAVIEDWMSRTFPDLQELIVFCEKWTPGQMTVIPPNRCHSRCLSVSEREGPLNLRKQKMKGTHPEEQDIYHNIQLCHFWTYSQRIYIILQWYFSSLLTDAVLIRARS